MPDQPDSPTSTRPRGAVLPIWALALFLAAMAALPARAQVLESYAIVQEDSSLWIRGRNVRLYGVVVPPAGRICRTSISPVRCGSRAMLALDFRIQGFVRCEVVSRNADRSVDGICTHDGVDLAAWMVRNGWALTRRDAPDEYVVLERLARARKAGLWGFPVDDVRRR
jgi:endonuclease YncB( thermonuclease family)